MTIIIMLSSPSFRSAFVFIINYLLLSGFTFTSFHFSWHLTICFFKVLYFYMYNCPKVLRIIYNHSHFYNSFCNQPALFEKLENANKPWNNNRTAHVNEWNQNKQKNPCYVTFKLTTLLMASLSELKSQKKDFFSIICSLAQHDVWSWRKQPDFL